MLMTMKSLTGLTATGRDDELGPVREIYFDDEQWVVRYFIVSTSRWLGRDVLIPPEAIKFPDLMAGRLQLELTRRQVEESPPISFDRPVSRQQAEAYFGHYGWPHYWAGTGSFGLSAPPLMLPTPNLPVDSVTEATKPKGDPHLRSFGEVTGYHVRGTDAEIGHVEDLLVDDEGWAIRYLVVDTRNWWPGKNVLILPRFVRAFDWGEKIAEVGLQREVIKNAPPFDVTQPLTRADEQRLHAYYGTDVYWSRVWPEQPSAAP